MTKSATLRWPSGLGRRMNPSKICSLIQLAVTSAVVGLASLAAAALTIVTVQGAAIAAGMCMLLALSKGLFRTRMVPDVTSQVSKIAGSALSATVVAYAVTVFLQGQETAAGRSVVFGWGLLFVALSVAMIGGIHVVSLLLKRTWSAGHLRARTLVLGSTSLAPELATELCIRRSYGVDVMAVVNTDRFPSSGPWLRDEVRSKVEATDAARLIIGPFSEESSAVLRTARWAGANGLAVYVVPRLHEMGVGLDSLSPDRVRGYPLVRVQPAAHPAVGLRLKRIFDIAVSASALLVLSPLMAVVALAVKLTSPGPVLFTQQRIGRGGKPITIHKFRSMADSGDPDNEWVSESRITGVGAILRRTAIDELPQLYSVLRGDMSLVGPRPERPAFVQQFRAEFEDYDERHRMPVGLTGLAQIMGLVGDSPISERIKYDNLYIDHWSLSGDLQILIKTIWSLLNQGRYKQQQIDLASALSTENETLSEAFFNNDDADGTIIDLRGGQLEQPGEEFEATRLMSTPTGSQQP